MSKFSQDTVSMLNVLLNVKLCVMNTSSSFNSVQNRQKLGKVRADNEDAYGKKLSLRMTRLIRKKESRERTWRLSSEKNRDRGRDSETKYSEHLLSKQMIMARYCSH